MSAVPQGENSAAYMLLILASVFVLGSFIITLVNPFWNGLEGSALFVFDTQWGQDLDTWFSMVHRWVGLILLIAIIYSAFIVTREPT